ncbi:MAG: LysM peptidoglycan-binding domain-containing protein [Actinomycetota bacterium]|nr:LysM peptidoglycan-binding domain-containing protein [Actinomycetota bacterium]
MPGNWPQVYEANRATVNDPDLIRVGQSLRIPL